MQVKNKKTGRFISQPKLDKICPICNKPFQTYPSHNRKFCSLRCRNIGYKTLSEYSVFKGSNSNFYTGAPREKIFCRTCNVKFTDYAWYKRKYCSQKCANIGIGLDHRGEKHHGWRGGKTINSQGYVDLTLREHPFADCNNMYAEHRYVMEQHLKRYLDPQEVVHHINHIKTDNRIENLQLFSNHNEHMKIGHSKRTKQVTP